jgi:exosortase E/protease (VPEID-CTERM system)
MMIALVLVLPVEVVLLSLRFSAQSLKHTPGLAANLIRLMPVAVHAMIAVACGIALIALVRRDEVGPPIREALERPHRRRFAWTLAHAALIVPFYVLTAHLIEGTAAAGPRGELLVVAWLGLGVIWGLSWCGLLLSDSAWAILARRLWPIAAIGASVGLAGLAVSLVAPRLWAPLTAVTFGSVRGLLEAVGSEVVSIPAESILGTERFRVRIGPSCSGYEGIGLMAGYLAALMIALRHRLRFPRAWLLLPLGLGAIWAANVARIAALILIGDQISPAIAKGGFHSQAGWLAFNAVSLTLLLVAVLSPWFVRIEKDREVGADLVLSPTSAYLMPFLVLIAASMVTGAMSAGSTPSACSPASPPSPPTGGRGPRVSPASRGPGPSVSASRCSPSGWRWNPSAGPDRRPAARSRAMSMRSALASGFSGSSPACSGRS